MFLLMQEENTFYREKFIMSQPLNYSEYRFRDSSAYQVLRGIHKADPYFIENCTDPSIMELAEDKAQDTQDKSAITIALEDFAEATNGFNGSNSSNIVPEDVKSGVFDKVLGFFGIKSDNIFKSEDGQELVKNEEKIYQSDIFNSSVAKYGGIEYAKQGDDLAQSALNFAKADIEAIEKAYSMANVDADKNGKLQTGEVNSYIDFDGYAPKCLDGLEFADGKKSLSAQEYASYMLAADGLIAIGDGVGHSESSMDGIITPEEAQLVQGLVDEEFKNLASQMYQEYFD